MQAALVLSGGGARGSYQAGVIRALTEIFAADREFPFSIVTGVSAGAINGAYVAAHFHDLSQKSHDLASLWSNIQTEDVFRTDMRTVVGLGWSWAKDLILGGLSHKTEANALLDVSPLAKLLGDRIPFDQLVKNIQGPCGLKAFEVSATDYSFANNVSFFMHEKPIPPWSRVGRKAEHAAIHLSHVMASSSIPFFFPPVEIDGRPYGDGSIRNSAPLSPAIKLGADKLLIIGVRHQGLGRLNPRPKSATVGRILSVILNSLLFEAFDQDIERLHRINHLIQLLPEEKKSADRARKIDVLQINPSIDIGDFAAENFKFLPKTMQYLLRGLGTRNESSELVSYLLFEKEYTSRLVSLGYQDTMDIKEAIQMFIYS